MGSQARLKVNEWLREQTADIKGQVISIGSGDDKDWEGGKYRHYFKSCDRYLTSDIAQNISVDLKLDAREMLAISTDTFDCVFCAGVLEHIDNMFAAMSEMVRILKPGGILLLGVPFGYAIHRPPQDFWRMTIYGLRYLLERYSLEEQELLEVEGGLKGYPACYWVKAVKK